MDKILITDLVARGIIGVYAWERSEPQEIRINAALFIDLRRAGRSDNVDDSVDYHALSNRLLEYAAGAHPLTVEKLAEDLARLCLEPPGVQRVVLRVEKPGALPFARAVGVEIERTAQDYSE